MSETMYVSYHPIHNTLCPSLRHLIGVMKILMALYWHWAPGAVSQCSFYGGLSPIAIPCPYPIAVPWSYPIVVPWPYPSDCFPPPAVPRPYPAIVLHSYPTPPPAAMQGHKSGVQQCRHSPPPRPDPRAVRACSCKPSLPAPDTRLGAQKNHKIFHSANSGGKFQPNATHERHKT